jgi:hypothetical protein
MLESARIGSGYRNPAVLVAKLTIRGALSKRNGKKRQMARNA